jgi:hypothetical protein
MLKNSSSSAAHSSKRKRIAQKPCGAVAQESDGAKQATSMGGADDNAAMREVLALAQETARRTGSPVILVIPPSVNSCGRVILDGKSTDQKEESTDETSTELLRELIENQNKQTELLRKITVSLDENSIDRLAEKITKGRKKDTVEAFVEGSVVVDTVCKIPKQDGKITPEEKGRQEEILLAHGVPPRKIAKFHNPNDDKKELRKKAQKVSNDRAKQKKKTPAGSVS